MKLREILSFSDENSLERFVADKIDDVVHLRLPKEVLIDEIADTVASYSYVSQAIGTRHPPCFEILDLLMKSEGNQIPIASFRRLVRDRVAEISEFADGDDSLALNKNYGLYARVLEVAWESDREIDASELSLLTALRRELGISFREHVVVEHTKRIRQFWQTDDAYERERNNLLTTGLLFTHEDQYVLPEEFPPLIRQIWSIDLPQKDYARFLSHLSTTKLYELLAQYGLKVAGTKEERIDRLVLN
ncbi:MAG: SAP domain-containing protein, partial [Rhodothermales bacterium]